VAGVHPGYKHIVGRRLYTASLGVAYSIDTVTMGPIYNGMAVEGDKIRVKFAHVAKGLVPAPGLTSVSSSADALAMFQIAAADTAYQSADAVIDGAGVIVSAPGISSPRFVRYASQASDENPIMKATLYNSAGLPASPFRSNVWGGLDADPVGVRSSSLPAHGHGFAGKVSHFSSAAVKLFDIRGRRIKAAESNFRTAQSKNQAWSAIIVVNDGKKAAAVTLPADRKMRLRNRE
jgi:hypothetical protein